MRQIILFQRLIFASLIFLLLFCVPFLFCGLIYKTVEDFSFLQNSVETIGEVTKYNEDFGGKVKVCSATVTFYTETGEKFEIKTSEIIGRDCHVEYPAIGDKVPVLYKKTDPMHAVKGTSSSVLEWKVVASIGLAVFYVILIFLTKILYVSNNNSN